MEIEYDPEKAASNAKKHGGVSFEEAAGALLDPYALTKDDPDSMDEPRFISLRERPMSDNSDPVYDRFKDEDFSNARPVGEVPPLAELQAGHAGRTSVTVSMDRDVWAKFKVRAETSGADYQALINEALREYLKERDLEDVIRSTIRETLRESRK